MAVSFKTQSLVLSRQLVTATGSLLYVNGLLVGSGIYSTINALTETGVALGNTIAASGQQAWTAAQNNAVNLSGNLTTTGQTLFNLTIGGDTNLSGNLTLTGQTLRALTLGGDTNLSGQLTTTGTLLSAVKVTGSAILNNVNLIGSGTVQIWASGNQVYVSGSNVDAINLSGSIAQTGQQAWNAANNNGINLSGNLTTTGVTLGAKIDSLSGFTIAASGALQTLISTAAGGVSSVNGQSGALTLAGTGGLTVISGGARLVLVSGDQSISGALTATGVALGTKIDSLSGFVGLVSGGLETRITASGNAAVNHANGIGINLSGNLTTTGQTLLGFIIGGDTNLSGNLTQTGITLRNLTLGGDTNLSGNLTLTGQTLYNLITSLSGVEEGVVVHRTGSELITGTKTFLSELRFNSGLKTPVRFFGPANTTFTSGDYLLIATGTTTSTTGIFPSSIDYSGVPFTLINGGTVSLQVSGVIGPDVNPILAPWDALQAYATSGQWWYLRQTGSPLLGLITSLSGYVGNVSGALQTNITANATNLSGNLTTTGVTLGAQIAGLSGVINTLYGTNIVYTTGNQNIQGSKVFNNQDSTITAFDANGSNRVAFVKAAGFAPKLIYASGITFEIDMATSGGALTPASASGGGNIPALSFDTSANTKIGQGGYMSGSSLVIQTQLNSLSGFVGNVSGALQILINNADADVSSINGQSGAITIAGTGGLTVLSGGAGLILVSGDTSISGALTQTGVTLGAKIDALSGFVGNVSGGLETRITATGNAAVTHANGIGINLSGNLALTGSNLYTMMTGLSGQAVIDYATKTNLTLTGQTLLGFIVGGDTNLSGNLTLTGQTLRALTLGGDTNLSGNLTTTGQTLYNLITAGSGQANINYAPALANYVYQSGNQLVTGIKTLLSELRFNSGVKTPVQFFGPSNYSLVSGNFMVIGTGVLSAATGIFPSPTDYSGVVLTLVNGGTTSLQVSGIIGPDTNPVLAPWDAIQAYATSGQWWYLRQTGSPLLSMITSLSGYVGNVSGALQTNITANAVNLSGNLTTTGQTLYQMMTGLSGQANTNYATVTNLALTGSNLYVTLTGMSGQAVTDYATKTSLALTGQQTWTAADANARNISGNLTTTGTLLSAVKVTGSAIINVVNLTGLGGTLVISSGGFVFISGAAAASAGVSSVNSLQGTISIVGTGGLTVSTNGQNILVSGDTSISGALTQTGVTLLNFIIGGDTNLSGNLTLTGQTLRVLTLGGDTNLSGNLTTTGQTLYNLITAASGQANTNYAPALANYVYQSGNQNITGVKTFGSGIFTGSVGIGTSAPLNPLDVNGIARFQQNLRFTSVNQSGSFTFAAGVYRYIWNGAANCTGTLPAVNSVSGIEFMVKNLSPTGSFVISGLIDYSQNYVLTPMQAINLWSDNTSWLLV